ncbi:putative beta-lactamase-like 1 isoform X2 [Nematostella vectensis]|nr:putative beta-lactamase-like 1 isoform X2 [Nematostella vectensis]XP_032236109.2 putative beta-lactamase-like 1 isoform X2 [Nematostella vectensis]
MNQNHDFPAGTTKYILKEERRRRCSHSTLLTLVIMLSMLSVVMTALFIWKVTCDSRQASSWATHEQIRRSSSIDFGCTFKPRPLKLYTLPHTIQESLRSLQDLISQEIRQGKATAVSASLVYRDEVVWSGGFGVMDKSANPPVPPTPDTIFPCASVSKVITAVMLFKLYQDKGLSWLDTPISHFEHGFTVRNPFANTTITLADLATQRSGLPREAPCYPPAPANLCPYDHRTMLRRIRNLNLQRKPGTEPQYSNLGWALIGQTLAQAYGGGNFSSWVAKNVFQPLDMADSAFTINQSQKHKIPVGYTSLDEFSQVQDWGWLAPAGGLFSSVRDLAKMEIALMSNTMFSRWVTQEFFKPAYVLKNGKDMIGTPWEMTMYNGLMIHEKTGYVYGYNSYLAMVPELKLAFNLMCTNCNKKLDINRKFESIVSTFYDTLVNASTQDFIVPPETRPYLGLYKADSSLPIIRRMDVTINREDKQPKLAIAVNHANLFFLNYTRPLHFKVRLNTGLSCKEMFTLGVDNDPVVFDPPSADDGLSDGFTMYNAHPSGYSYFTRVR